MIYKEKNIGIIGLGYVGAPLAYLAASKGYNVIGIDKDDTAIENINKRTNIPKELKEFENFKLIASNDYAILQNVDTIIVCVPTPTKNNKPDLTILKNVMEDLKDFLKRDSLLIIESTVAPGMTKQYVEDFLLKEKGFRVNEYYDLAYCPERIDPGNKKYWVGNINRVCGATSENALQEACEFYKSIIDAEIIPMGSIEEAELVKVWENSMRNISIAQSNLLAMICDKYNFSVKRLMKGLNSKVEQFGLSLAYPGIGPGGHCIPEDIHYLINTSEKNIDINMNLLKEAVKINENMPRYAFDKLVETISKNGDNINKMKILMLGVSYKANSADTRCSKALELYNIVSKKHKDIILFDPIANIKFKDIKSQEIFNDNINDSEIIILGCAHDEFLKIDFTEYKNVKYILDCWNKLDKEKIQKSGITYIGVGI